MVMIGFAAIGYGIPVNEFSFGNTLIISGTIGVAGGLLLTGLAACVQQLKRLAEGDLLRQARMPLPAHPDDTFRQQVPPSFPAGPAITQTASKLEPVTRVSAPPEPKLGPALSAVPEPLEWLRPKEKAQSTSDQSLIEEIEASLAPKPIPQASSPPPLKIYDQTLQQKQLGQNAPVEPVGEASQAPRSASPFEYPAQSVPGGLFDAVWPEAPPARHPESIPRARKPETARPVPDEGNARGQSGARKDSPRVEPGVPPDEPRPVAILKSGMIDGMAYTLYADGSIEAVLATGTVRFASIDALRIHLEKNG